MRIAFGSVVAATALLVFLVPLRVPVAYQPTISASYVAGFDNHAAVIAAALIGIAVLLWAWWRTMEQGLEGAFANPAEGRIGPVFFAAVLCATFLVSAVAEWLIRHSQLRYLGDAGYFIEQMSSHVEYGRSLYTQLEFAYGPLLFYPTILLHEWLRCDWLLAYFVTLGLDQAIGLTLLTYVVNELPIGRFDRRFALVLFAAGALTPLLGLNYTFLRFITPFAMMLLATRADSAWRTTALLSVGEMIALGVSPELGFAFVLGVATFAVLKAWHSGWQWAFVAAAPLLGAGSFLLVVRRPYLRMLQSFSRGALNLPVAPYPHVIVFLLALVWLVPVVTGKALGARKPVGMRLAACYAIAIGLLPPAFGRCDPLHVFFNGAGLLVLSLVGLRSQPRRVRVAWLASLLSLVAWEQWVNNTLYLERTADTLRLAWMPRLKTSVRERMLATIDRQDPDLADHLRPTAEDREYQLDVPALEQQVGHAQVATPWEVSPALEDALKRTGHYLPDRYSFFVDVLNAAGERTKIHDMNEAEWALLPVDRDDVLLETPQNIDGVQGFAFPYAMRNPMPYRLGDAFDQNLEDEWQELRRFGPYMLYQRRRHAMPPAH